MGESIKMIAIACDHAAPLLKNEVIAHLKSNGFDVFDLGTNNDASVDYPDYALKCAEIVSSGECEKGILICGTGIGMSIAANKVKGIRCAHCTDEFSAKMAREHNDANIIAVGARISDKESIIKMIDIFLQTPFSAEPRHKTRVDKITQIEDRYFK